MAAPGVADPSENELTSSPQIRLYRCNLCGASRSKRSLILSHMQKCHPLSPSDFSVEGKDQRRYKCPVCGDCRSKLALLRDHIRNIHSCSPQVSESTDSSKVALHLPETRKRKCVECNECGRLAKKPSLLQQHLCAHSAELQFMRQNSTEKGDLSGSPGCIWLMWNDNERHFMCDKGGCGKSFKTPGHLKRHLLQHDEMPLLCPWPGCIMLCSNHCNLRRHLRRHNVKGDLQRGTLDTKKVHKCPEPGCGAAFDYPCRLESHRCIAHGLHYTDIRCGEPGCAKSFMNAKVLLEHIRHSHKTAVCHICGVSLLRKSLKRHVLGHDASQRKKRLFCPLDNCGHSFANSYNLSVHLKVHHLGEREYHCTFDGCSRTFGYRHARDNHERKHFRPYVQGDFEEEDRKFQARCRGGRKPVTLQKVEDLLRRRVMCAKEE